MKNVSIIILVLAGVLRLSSQTITPVLLSNQGGYSSLSQGSVSWSIGEPVSESYTTTTNKTTMGFHQPELSIINMINEQGNEAEVLVYPNPVKELLNINFIGLNNGNYKLELFDDLGRLIIKSGIDVSEKNQIAQLKINEVAAGNYFLRVDGKDFSKSIKIIKVN